MEELLNPNWYIEPAWNYRDSPSYTFSNKYECAEGFTYEKTSSREKNHEKFFKNRKEK